MISVIKSVIWGLCFVVSLVGLLADIHAQDAQPAQELQPRRERGGFDRGGFGRGGGDLGDFGGRGGFGGNRRGGGLLGEVQNEATRSEIKLTDEQLQKLQEIGESATGNREQFGELIGRMQAAESEEARNAIRDEMRAKMEETRSQAEAKMKAVLTEEQFQRLNQIRLHREGTRALGREDIQGELGLSDQQKAQLQALQDERSQRFREMGFGASEEDREKMRVEFEQKTMNILTAAQREQWQQKLGPPPADAGQARPPFSGRPGVGPGVPEQPRRRVVVEEVPDGAQSVMSFGNSGVEQPADPASSPNPVAETPTENVRLSFNFRYAPWTDVLRLFAREAKLSLDLIDVPPGTFSYYDQGSYTPREALDVLNGYLLPKGYVLVHRDDFLVCLNIDDPIPPNLIPNVLPEDLANRGRNELLTVVFPLEGVEAAQIATEINEVKGPQGKVVALTSTNSVLVTDIGSNLRRIHAMLQDVTSRPGPNEASFKAYEIKNIAATEAENLLRSVLGIGSGVANVSAGSSSSRSSSSRSATSTPITISADTRTNKLLISANTKTHLLIEEALKTIDVEGEASGFSPASNQPFLRVYSVTSADAREVVKTIDAIMPGIVVNEDGRNGKIHILASPDKHAEVENLIRQMDGLGAVTQQMTVIPLSTMDPISAAATLQTMFLKDGELAPTVEPDIYGRQLLIRGDANQILQIKGLLAQLGEDGTGQKDRSNQSRLRTFNLSGRDPEEILPLIQRMWQQKSGASIRVITPNDRGPVRDIITPGDDQTIQEQEESRKSPASTRRAPSIPLTPEVSPPQDQIRPGNVPLRTASQSTLIAQVDAKPPESSAEESSPTPSPSKSSANEISDDELLDLLERYVEQAAEKEAVTTDQPQSKTSGAPDSTAETPTSGETSPAAADVNITVMGNELLISSTSPEALNELEDLLQSTLQAIPPRTTWTVFTLQTADATEASLMLEQLLPYSNVSSTSGGGGMLGSLSGAASSLGSGLANMTGLSSIASAGQTLRIIPDTRLNALFVSGPSAQVKEVEEMLRVLDANEWPDTFRDKLTRMIPLEHADANDVLKIVKETYKVYIDPPQQQQGRGNPLAAMMGGGGRSNGRDDNSPESQVKMAVSVDTNTNHLAIWADEPLFREVESLVKSIDESAREARRTVRVVPLQNTNSSVIQSALGTLMPRVNVSSTGTRRTSSDSDNNRNDSNSNNNAPSNADQDRIRQFFEQRMRERMQQDAGGGDRSGGGRPSVSPFSGRTGGSPFGGGRPGGTRPGGR